MNFKKPSPRLVCLGRKILNKKIQKGVLIFYFAFFVIFNLFLTVPVVHAATVTLRPSGEGAYTEFSNQYPGSGFHWDKVDESPPDDGSTFVYPDLFTLNQRDLYDLPDSGIPAGATINSVQIYTRANRGYEEVEWPGFSIGFRDGTGDWWGDTKYPDELWANFDTGVLSTNPRTSSAWTLAQINSLQIGAKYSVLGGMTQPAFEQFYAVITYTSSSTISISSPADISLGSIVGTGSTNSSVTWQIVTDNAAGYKLEWQASAATMTNSYSDTIAAYTPAVANTPETWSVLSTASEWGARLKSASTDNAAEWGTDGVSEKWLNVNNAAVRQIVTRGSATAGSNEIVQFKAEVGSSKLQPTGTYTVNITMTATTL